MATQKQRESLSRRRHWITLNSILILVALSLAKSATLSSQSLDPELQLYPSVMAKEANKTWSDLRVAVYMTTHWSPLHVEFLQKCWPTATTRYPLLHDSHLILYTSIQPDQQVLELLHFQSITIKIQPQSKITANSTKAESQAVKQIGAKRAMIDPWPENTTSSWFDGYDWVVRLNPDVLVRDDTWLRETMLNESVDLIAVDFTHPVHEWAALHTDFYAFRPEKIDKRALRAELHRQPTAERHLGTALLPLRAANRTAWIPGAKRAGRQARVLGTHSPVIHWHKLIGNCPNYHNATTGPGARKWW